MYENSVDAAVLASLSPSSAASLNPPDARLLQQQQMHIMSSLSHKSVWEDYQQCGHHRAIITSLACALQVITLCCPSALIWVIPRSQVELLSPPLPPVQPEEEGHTGDQQMPQHVDEGSPLDYLAVSPSELPLPFSAYSSSTFFSEQQQEGTNELCAEVRDQLLYAEELIRNRSMAIEQRWSSAKYQESSFGNEVQRVLEIVEQLDIFDFHQTSEEFNMKTLFQSVFKKSTYPSSSAASSGNVGKNSESSDWLVVKTLCDWSTSFYRPGCHRAPVVAALLSHYQLWIEAQDPTGSRHHFVCQKFITKFLDEFAPTLNHPPGHENNSFEEERTFASLVLLIHELIDAAVFSHDHYMRLLISRGDLCTCALFHQDLDSSDDYSASENTAADGETESICDFSGKRHLLYALHFPVSRDNSNDVNQRLMLLYGFGTKRDEALASQHSVMRQLSGILTSQHSEMPTNLDESSWADIRNSFLKLSYNDRQNVVAHCYNQIVYQLDSAVDDSSSIRTALPPSKAIDFVMQLSESAACVSLILDIAECILSAYSAMNEIFPTEYSNALVMTAVSAMENYMPYLLIADQMAATLFESVVTAVEGVKRSPSSCSSAERCLLHLLEHMINSSHMLKQSVDPPEKYDQLLTSLNQTPAVPKFQESRPQSSSASEDSFIAKSFLEKPSDVDEDALCQVISRIHSKENFRSVLISSALIKLCDLKDSDDKFKKANDLSVLCIELTSRVPFLKTDWFTAVTIICSQKTCGNNKTLDLLVKKINIENSGVYDNLVLFICYMVSRHLFKLEEVFVKLIHSILAILNVNSDSSGQEREIAASTRLSMYVLLKLLHANQQLDCLRLNVFEHVHSDPDRLLLAVQMRPVNVGLLVAILKAFATHVPINTNADDEDNRKPSQFESNWTSAQVLEFVGSANLQEVACAVLHALASCTWITYSCLRNPGILKADEILLDPIGGERLASHILQLLCYPGSPVKGCRYTEGSALTSTQGGAHAQVASAAATAAGVDEQEIKLRRIFEKLNKWNHRSSWLQFTIILELCEWKKQVDLVNLLARLSIQIFDIQPVVELRSSQRRVPKPVQNSSSNSSSSNLDKPSSENVTGSSAGSGTEGGKSSTSTGNNRDPEQAWLVAPLIGQLPAAVQGAVLNQASSMLDRGGVLGNLGQNLGSSSFFSGGLGSTSKPRSDKEKTAQKSIQLLSHGPFLSLVLTCLKGQDDQRESLLSSLQTQFSQMIREQQHIISLTSGTASNVTSLSSTAGSGGMSLDELQASRMKMFNDEWQLRLSLLGSMFDSILRSQSLCTDWIVNLVNLLEKDIINPVDNPQLFYTVVDMLIVLIEFNSGDHPAADEQSKKSYNSSVKKIRNIIGEKQNEGLRMVRQLLPLQKCSVDVVCCEPVGTVYDSKGNKIENSHLAQGLASNKYQGNQIVGKQKLSPWDLIEGFKIQAPLQLNWFNAVRMERGKPSVYEEQARAMFYHDHSPLERSQSYFMQPIETPKSGGPSGPGVSDDDDVQVEAPPSASTPTPTSASAPKSGNQIVGKQKLSPWDLIEGFKIQAPLQLNWFNAVRMERGKPSVYEEQARAMFYHDHSPLERSQSYFMQPIETPKSGGPSGPGVSDDDDVQVEAPPSASTPTPTSASAPKSKSRYNKSGGSTSSSAGGSGGANGSGGNKKQTKSRKKTSQQQQQQQQQPVPVVAPAVTPMGSSSIPPQSFTPAPSGSAGGSFTQQVQSISNQSAMQQSQSRFMGAANTGVNGGAAAPNNTGIVLQNNQTSVQVNRCSRCISNNNNNSNNQSAIFLWQTHLK
ncbi:mediator of RNA polymerase II transcription subunit 12-like protein isoform X3 [Convolutriloba macropyga]